MIKKTNYIKLLKKIIIISKKANVIINRMHKENLKSNSLYYTLKKNFTPLTLADKKMSDFLTAEIKKLKLKIPIISEEKINNKKFTQPITYWLIDPLDGTREYINNSHEFTFNISLIHNSMPVIGLISHPWSGAIYYATKYTPSYKFDGKSNKLIQFKKNSLKESNLRFVVSKSYLSEKTLNFVEKNGGDYTKMGSSLKFCKILDGNFDVYVRHGELHTWDTASGYLLIKRAGGLVTDLSNKPLKFKQPFKKHSNILVSNNTQHKLFIFE